MIRFLFLGIIRDKGRSLMPILIVSIGVMLCVLMHAYVNGVMGDTIELNARFNTGHLKITTKAYADNIGQLPNDLALLKVSSLLANLEKEFPEIDWVPRIHFGGLIDTPDSAGMTKTQGPAMGMGLDLLSGKTSEDWRLRLSESLVRGKMPAKKGEVLLSETFSQKLKVNPGEKVTFIGSTMNGSMAIHNFKLAGTVRFGNQLLDRGTIIADIEDIRLALDMEDAAAEITGFFKTGYYDEEKANEMKELFNKHFPDLTDEFRPQMQRLSDQGGMGYFVGLAKSMSLIVTLVFMFAMSLVLWNAGLLGGLRRYGEIGLRLAIGEEKRHVYFSMIAESIIIGMIGSIFGTMLGLFFAWLIQTYGIDVSAMMKGSSVLMPTIIRAHITPVDFYLGFIPGVISTVIGTALSGIGIYKRKTAQLFKELEV